jgi:hypothetical protein
LPVNDLDRKARFLVHRESVEIAAQAVGFNRNLQRRTLSVPLKTACSIKCEIPLTQMVRDALLYEKKSERHGTHIGHLVGENR